jgi:hypothetical protein
MLTIFTCPKKFEKKIGVIQTNAINSWKSLDPKIQIILIGNDPTVKKFAEKNDVEFADGVQVNDYGTPYVDSIFEIAEKKSRYDILVYINADLILFNDFLDAVSAVRGGFRRFLVTGQRRDLEVNKLINFFDTESRETVYNLARQKGRKHGYTGMDYFVFKKRSLGHIPKFLIGRDEWDNWMVYNALIKGIKTIDATGGITAVHQNHGYFHLTRKKKSDEESANDVLARGKTATLHDVQYSLRSDLILHKKSPAELFLPKLLVLIRLNLIYLYKKLAGRSY